jgi:hypothetical protein
MSEVLRALTGPAAAALLDLHGFRDLKWPLLWCAPIHVEPMDDLIRTRRWERPAVRGGHVIAAPHLVLRHLNALPAEAYEQGDGLTVRDRIAFATEHALYSKLVDQRALTFTGGPQNGSHLLREYLEWRGVEPATESWAVGIVVVRSAFLLQSFCSWRSIADNFMTTTLDSNVIMSAI